MASGWKTALAAAAIVCVFVGVAGWCVRQVLGAIPASMPHPSGPHPVEGAKFAWKDPNRALEISVVLWSPVLQKPQRLPLLLLSPAMGRTPENYSFFGADLASHGYIVAGVTPTQTAPIDLDHREKMQPVVENWVADVRFALDQLEREPDVRKRLDEARIGIFGHSFGGATAIHALRVDSRFRRAANLDGAPQGDLVTGLTRPVLIVLGAALPPSKKKLNDAILNEIHEICASDTAGCQIEDRLEARHMNFSDAGLSPFPVPLLRAHQGLGDINGRAFLSSMGDRLRTFFDAM